MAELHIRKFEDGRLISPATSHTIVDFYYNERITSTFDVEQEGQDAVLVCIHWNDYEEPMASVIAVKQPTWNGDNAVNRELCNSLINDRNLLRTFLKDAYHSFGAKLITVNIKPPIFTFLHSQSDLFMREGNQFMRMLQNLFSKCVPSGPDIDVTIKITKEIGVPCTLLHHDFHQDASSMDCQGLPSASVSLNARRQDILDRERRFVVIRDKMSKQKTFMASQFAIQKTCTDEMNARLELVIDELKKGKSRQSYKNTSVAETKSFSRNYDLNSESVLEDPHDDLYEVTTPPLTEEEDDVKKEEEESIHHTSQEDRLRYSKPESSSTFLLVCDEDEQLSHTENTSSLTSSSHSETVTERRVPTTGMNYTNTFTIEGTMTDSSSSYMQDRVTQSPDSLTQNSRSVEHLRQEDSHETSESRVRARLTGKSVAKSMEKSKQAIQSNKTEDDNQLTRVKVVESTLAATGQGMKGLQQLIDELCRSNPCEVGMWTAVNEQLTKDAESIPRAEFVLSTVFCLDTSGSISPQAMDEMKAIVLDFINGIEEIAENHDLEENIGLVTFGGVGKVLHRPTNDYGSLKDSVEIISCGGMSPLLKGSLISLTCLSTSDVCSNGGPHVLQRLIFITDGHASTELDEGSQDVYNCSQLERLRLIEAFRTMGNEFSEPGIINFIWIPIGNADRSFMSSLATFCKGNLIEGSEVRKLCNFQRIRRTAQYILETLKVQEADAESMQLDAMISALETDLRTEEKEEIKSLVHTNLCRGNNTDYMSPENFDNVNIETQLPPLGSRVIRGPDWMWDHQDSNGPGTIVNHHKNRGSVYVLWDNGYVNVYRYGSAGAYDVLLDDGCPRQFHNGQIPEIGLQVQRGPDWLESYGEQDGRPGSHGVIIRIRGGWVMVRWENGSINKYRFGEDDRYDLIMRDAASCLMTKSLESELGVLGIEQQGKKKSSKEDNESYVWQRLDERGEWQTYSKDENVKIMREYTKGKHSCLVSRGGEGYRICFKIEIERRIKDNSTTRVRRVPTELMLLRSDECSPRGPNQIQVYETSEIHAGEQDPEQSSDHILLPQEDQNDIETSLPVETVGNSFNVDLDTLDDQTINHNSVNAVDIQLSDNYSQQTQRHTEEKESGQSSMTENVLVEFLSKVLDCPVNASATTETKYRDNSLNIHTTDVPGTPEDVPDCLGCILQHIISHQTSRIKFTIKCYSACEDFEQSYSDTLVFCASNWLKNFCLDVIMTNLIIESSTSEDLCSDYVDKHSSPDAVNFLWRVAGLADDSVFVSEALLCRLLQTIGPREDNSAVTLLRILLKAAGQQLTNVERMDEMIPCEGRTFRSLEHLLANPPVGAVIASALQQEVLEATQGLGNYFEKTSIFGPLLAVSTAPTKFAKNGQIKLPDSVVTPFVCLPGFPSGPADQLIRVQSSIQKGLHRCQNIVYSGLKKVVTCKETREQGLSWISSVISLNELRTSAFFQNDTQTEACCSDAYMLNFCGVLLEFFLPIHNDADKLAKVDLNYFASDACRLKYDFETCLAGSQIVSDRSEDREIEQESLELQTKHSFITECFHLCQRALSVGVIPAVGHYMKMQREFSLRIHQQQNEDELIRSQHVLVTVLWDTCLCDEELVRNVSSFYLSQARLLLKLLKNTGQGTSSVDDRIKEQKKAFSKIPEFCVKDMAVWFRFVAACTMNNHREVLQGLEMSTFVDCCVSLLERPDLMPGPIPASKMVSCLQQFVTPSKHPHSRGWGTGVMSDLAVMVETCPSVQNQLGPALIRTYISVDVVEGLDVDKDEFDKYSARSEIGQLIEHLWKRVDCRASMLRQCGTDLFQNFLGAVLDTLLYMLHDGLFRLANIKKIEVAKQNYVEWNTLSLKEQMGKENVLRKEEFVAKMFMNAANQTLEFIELLTRAEEVARCFTRQPLATRSASVICGFLDSLCGSRAKDFKVKNIEKYKFSPKKLLLQITTIVLRISREVTSSNDSFLVSMATDSDFSAGNFEKAHSVLSSKHLVNEDLIKQLDLLIQQLKKLNVEKRSFEKRSTSKEEDLLQELASVTVDKERIVEVYTRCMADSRYISGNIKDSHSFQSNIQSIDSRSPKVKALMKEMKQLQQHLPIHPDATVCVVQDEERIDVMRAMLTGPVGTPYSLGCFAFDIYFPASYPNSAPLVKLITTGGGTVRFNPNLYSDGKVCLSLLGTWHGGDASEKWNPGQSSLYQVLVSIQSLILIPEPMYNEPGYEGMKGTAEGDRLCTAFNWQIRLNTLRHAILCQLKNPPPGLKRVIQRHLALQRECVLKQCREWLGECEGEDQEKRMSQVVAEILAEMKDIQIEEEEEEQEEEQ